MNNRELALALICAVALVAVHLLGALAPSSLTWGFNALAFLPAPYLAGYLLLALAAIVFVRNGALRPAVSSAASFMERSPYRFIVSAIGLFIVAAVTLRIRVPLLGDGFFLVRNFAEALRGTEPLLYRNEPLATSYVFSVVRLFNPTTYAGFLNAFLTADVFLAAGFIVNLFFIVKTLFADKEDRFLAFLLLLVIPYAQLFFGYVEVYGAVLFALSLYVLVAVRVLKAKMPFTWLPAAFLLMAATHYLTLLLAPSLLVLSYSEWRQGSRQRLALGFGAAALLALGLLLLVDFELSRFSAAVPHSHLLPLVPSTDPEEIASTPYTMFSPYHGLDLLNFAILVLSPAILLIIAAGRALRAGFARSHESLFLLGAILPLLAFLIAAKFDLGAAKDWDVCAPYAFLTALFALLLLLREPSPARRGVVLLAALLSLLQTAAYVKVNSGDAEAVHRYRTLLDRRTMSNGAYYSATLHLASYFHQVQDTVGPAELWQQFVTAFPQDSRGYQNLITNSERFGPAAYGRIMSTYEQWLQMNPTDTVAIITYSGFCLDAGNERYAAGSLEEAARLYEKAVAVDPLLERACNNLGSIYAQRGELTKAIDYFQRAILIDSTYSDPYYNLGSAYEDRGEKAKGLALKKQAARLGNAAAQTHLGKKHITW